MKKLYLGLLSAWFGTILWLGFVKGDIIDPGIRTSEGRGFWDPVEITTETEEINGRNSSVTKSIVEIKELIPNSVWRIIISTYEAFFVVSVRVVLFFVFSLILWYMLENLSVEPWKNLIPSFCWIKKWLFVAFLLIIIWLILFMMIYVINCPYHACYHNNDGPIYYPNNRAWMFDLVWNILLGIGFLLFSFIMLLAYYRLFRKFGWNKWYSVLWTIFFPIWVCVLWFGNFEYQWENLEKKEWNN